MHGLSTSHQTAHCTLQVISTCIILFEILLCHCAKFDDVVIVSPLFYSINYICSVLYPNKQLNFFCD